MATLSRIAPEVPVTDLQAALALYEQKLGFAVAAEAPGGDYAIVERDGVAIHLFLDEGRRSSPVGMHIFTHQLDELRQELADRGAAFSQGIQRKPWGTRDFRVKDDWGNELKFTEPS